MRIKNTIGETATKLSEYFDKIPRHYCSHFDGGPNPRYNPARVIQREVFSQLDTVLYSALCTYISQNPDSGIVTRIDGYTEVMDLELNYHIGSRFKASLLILFKYNSRPKQHMLRRAESIFNSSLKYHEDYWLAVLSIGISQNNWQVDLITPTLKMLTVLWDFPVVIVPKPMNLSLIHISEPTRPY